MFATIRLSPTLSVASTRTAALANGPAVVGEIAGDDDAVRAGVETHHPGEGELQSGGGSRPERPGGDVRVAQLSDVRRHPPMIRRQPGLTTERS